jgi:two-component system NtrC family response regulator
MVVSAARALEVDTGSTDVRVLVIGEASSISNSIAELPATFDVEFASAEEILGGSIGERIAGCEALLLDAGSLAPAARKKRVRSIVKALRKQAPRTKLIALVGSNDGNTAAVAADSGAWDVATPRDRCALAARLRAAAGCREFEERAGSGPQASGRAWEMIGTSPSMRSVFSLIRQVGTTDVPVLINGESGTGKELAALAIHDRSHRADGPFVPINCAAIPEPLLETELFGHERGAFTGAVRTSRGTVEAAHRGTLFLDEVGALAPGLQAKLLRFLEDHIAVRVGGRTRFRVDVRVIAATNRDLAVAVEEGEFRRDLYYRLAVFPLEMPRLQDRAEDVLLMARIFLNRYARETGRSLRGFSSDAIDGLWKYSWPGNVRELINRVRRAVVVAAGPLVSAADLGLELSPVEAPMLTLRESLERAEVDAIRRALERTKGNRLRAARLLGISRSALYERLRRHRFE